MLSSLLITTIACLSISANPASSEFSLGDAAPKFETKEFVKGEPVKEFAKGKTYVVEFWATWCGPCKESIPHITELQKKFKDVAFVGVSEDDDVDLVKPFVDKMGEKMDYSVAIDARDGKHGKMGSTWLEASGQGGIPTAYVINGDGKVAWIGHPTDLEEPLKQIIDGKWDLVAKAAEYKKEMEGQSFTRKADEQLTKLVKDAKYADALKLCDEIVARKNELASQIGEIRLALMVQLHGDSEKIIALAKELAKEGNPVDSAPILECIIDPKTRLAPESEAKPESQVKLDPALAKFVLTEANKIDASLKPESEGKPGDKPAASQSSDEAAADSVGDDGFHIADTHIILARVYQLTGDKVKAAAKYDDAVKVLNSVVRTARDDIKEIHAMKKALDDDGKPADDKATENKSSDDSDAKTIVRRKKKTVEP